MLCHPEKECCITISYISKLNLIQYGRTIRFTVSTTIASCYNSNQGGISSSAGTASKYVQSSPYTIEVSRISSSSRSIQLDVGEPNVYVIEFAQQNIHLDRDVLLDNDLTENRSNTIVAIEPGAVIASFTPTDEGYRRAMNNTAMPNEFMFIIDCSGSMTSEKKIG
ncbi:unnamed protein product [Rotaria sp. Silwood2]|nr:unnamed protein product [Rotaria sp. Silwood2]